MVTGGASGMGEAVCHHLGRRGDLVAVLDVQGDGAERVAKEVQAAGARALACEADVTDRTAVDEATDRVRREFGPVQILVTSAGLPGFEAFTDISPESWNRIIAVNLTGTFHCIQAVISDMVAARWGRIVTISSSSGQRGAPRMAHYAAAKGAVIALTKTLAREYGPYGITVNNVPPSAIETPMQHKGQAQGNLPPNEEMAKAVPLGHLGTADDIASACAFLTSDAAGFITGQVLGVNGGSVVV
jgi:2-hydroxycyclohexanecarboxyl-CoA dehydrogenase